MRRRALLMGGKATPNTIIGGIGGTINTKTLLATKLGISESIIRGFEVVGNDVHARITSNYYPKLDAFRDDYMINKYEDLEGLIISLPLDGAFRNSGLEELNLPAVTHLSAYSISYCQYLKYLNLPSATFFGPQSVRNNTGLLEFHAPNLETIGNISGGQQNLFNSYTSCNLISMRKLKVYGSPTQGTTGNLSGFTNLKLNCVIEVHEDLATANAGNPNQSLIWVKANRGATVEFYDDDGNYVSTL